VGRFVWAAGSGSYHFPYTIVNSGHKYTSDYTTPTTKSLYSSMVDAELLRPPQAKIIVNSSTRSGKTLTVKIDVTNKSGRKLSSGNQATLFLLVYEDNSSVVTQKIASRTVRASKWILLPSALNDKETQTYTLSLSVSGAVDWNKMHAVVLFDYMPNGAINDFTYDMLQAVRVPISN